eukprot:gene11934-5335_t
MEEVEDLEEEEQLRIALELSEKEEIERKLNEFEKEENNNKELIELNTISESKDGGLFKKSISDFLEPYIDDDLVKSFQLDESKEELILSIDIIENEYKIKINYPNGGKSGKYNVIQILSGKNIDKSDKFTTIDQCMEHILQIAFDERDSYLEMYGGEFIPLGTGSQEYNSDDDFEGDFAEDEDGNLVIDDIELEGDFEDHTYFGAVEDYFQQMIQSDIGKEYHSYRVLVGQEQIVLSFAMDPVVFKLSPIQAYAWGIDLTKFIGITLTIFTLQGQEEKTPKVEVYQCGNVSKLEKNVYLDKKKFSLFWTISDRITFGFLGKKFWWPFSEIKRKEGKNFIEAIVSYVQNVVNNCAKLCLICAENMPFEGLKPSVCSKQLCVFRHEQFGLGIDLESEIIHSNIYILLKVDPEIVDLMITMAYCAATADDGKFDPFLPFPTGVEVKTKDKFTQIETTHDFFKSNGKHDKKRVGELISKIPALETLQEWTKEGKLKDNCNKNIGVLCYPFLRWILASNRCFLKKLEGKHKIQQMKTEHQYALLSSTPEKEAIFREAKKKYGSFYAWHGSALCNWHAIMRNGLKNMSGTSGQRHGAAYGSGVYLAPDSSTSFGYMQYNPGWKNSTFGTKSIGCLALCEVANHPMLKGQPNPHYVVPDDSLIETRYFLVFPSGCNSSVKASTIKQKDMKEYIL